MPVAVPLIGAAGAIGAAALSKPKSQKDPNAYLKPYLNQAAGAAQGAFNTGGPTPYQGQTVADLSGTTLNSLDNTLNRALRGSPVTGAAQNYVQQGLQTPVSTSFGDSANPFSASVYNGSGVNPYASSIGGGADTNPYAVSVGGGSAFNPFSRNVNPGSAYNPFSQSVGGGAMYNPYASTANPFGQGQNPGLDAAFNYAADKTQNRIASEFAGSGRNLTASIPVRQDILSTLAAQIYAPAYESERNREASYAQQQLGIGAQGFESGQSRNLTANLAGQGIGAQAFGDYQNRALTSGLAGQQIGAQSFNDAQNRNLTANLNAQNIGAGTFDAAQNRNLTAGLNAQNIGAGTFDLSQQLAQQAALQGQQIGAQGYENAQSRALQDLTSQRQQQLGMLGFASPLAAQDYMDLAAQRDVGNVYDQRAQAQLDSNINLFNQQQNAPYVNLQNYLNNLNGLKSATGPAVQPAQTPNYLAAGAGGALLANQLYPYKGVSPYAPYNGSGGGISADQALAYSLGGLF